MQKIFLLSLCFLFTQNLFSFPIDYDPSKNAPGFMDQAIAEYKFKQRRACHQEAADDFTSTMAEWDEPNDPQKFFIADYTYKNLEAMDMAGLKMATLETTPWSGDYWPYAAGLLANRIADPEYKTLTSWKEKFDYVNANPAEEIYATADSHLINKLSVAEKYDLLAGELSFPLTQNMWEQGKAIYDQEGKVEEWMGLCHGWAPAAIIQAKPFNAIELPSFDNKVKIKFYPDELKGLTTYSWANAKYPTHFVGRRCQEKDPESDDNDRTIKPECLDLNPATWHITLVNQIGDLKESFVMDATYDYEVWNHPVFFYQYAYYNFATGQEAENYDAAVIKIEDYTKDPYKEHRSPKAKYIVGIQSLVGFVYESQAAQKDIEEPDNSQTTFLPYYYDLELDENGNIVGGEWYQKNHPDFIWKAAAGATADNVLDTYADVNDIDPEKPLTGRWQQLLKYGAQYGYVVNSLVNYLIELAQ